MQIRESTESDLDTVLSVERAAFGRDTEADLARDLLTDLTAQPLLSLLAFEGDKAVGHILFTNARLADAQGQAPSLSFLAPLAVVPDRQKRGIGSQLIKTGLELLSASGIDLVFTAGHPGYYPRFGFQPAAPHGFVPPYPIPEEHADAWMVNALTSSLIESVTGRVICADPFMKPELWRG